LTPSSAVSWWITTSASARITACITALGSSASATTASAPSAPSAPAFCSERVIATIWW
jgi:hypothetical protein